MLPKLRYKIKYICGDPYYEEMSIEEFNEKNFLDPIPGKELRSYADVDEWLEDNIHDMMPVDGPQSRMYCQKFGPTDFPELPPDQRPKSIFIWKSHHSVCDGVCCAALHHQLSDEFGPQCFFGGEKKATFLQAMFVRISGLLYLFCILIAKTLTIKSNINMFTERRLKCGMSGKSHINTIPG